MSFEEQMAKNFAAFLDGFSVFLVGVTMVFFALVLLILLIKFIGYAVEKMDGGAKPAAKVVKVPQVIPATQAPVIETNKMDDLELVAVITAALAASMGTTTDKLKVRSLRQVTRQK